MKTKLNLVAAGLFLAALGTGLGQSPVITQQPQSCTNVVGTTATFTVEATGTAPLDYQWQNLAGDWLDLMDCTNTALVLTNVQAGHAGDYRVVVTNIEAAVTSTVAHLYVIPPATLRFALGSYTVAENGGTVSLTVQRLNDTKSAVAVDYATTDGSATNGLKYTATNGTLTFAAGETSKAIVVQILNDGLVQSTRYFRVSLSNPAGGAVLGTPATALVYITDNDAGLQLECDSYSVGEGDGFILLAVLRGDDGNFPVSVDYFTTDRTATNGVDYTGVTNTLFLAPGAKVQTFTIPILNDGVKETSKYFVVTLRNPTNQVLGAQKTTTVTIVDNDPGVQFEFDHYWVQEKDGAVTVKVLRGNDGNLGPFAVDFATSDLTATNGLNYVATNGTLTFAQGEMAKTVTVPILNDEAPKPDKQFKVTLSNPTGGAALGPYATATITILDTTGMKPHRFDGVAVLPDRSVRLILEGSVHARFSDYYDLYPIEVSSNLVDWTPLVTLQRTNAVTNVLSFTDTETTNNATRFYRTPSNHLITPFVFKPTGPFAAGVVSRLLTDPSRRNRYNDSTNSSFMLSIWYPAVAQAGRLPALFEHPQLARDPTVVYGPWTTFMDRWPYLVTYALPDAPCATNNAPYPIVLYSPGGTGDHAHASERGPYLASYGYVVVGLEHYDCFATVFPDGTQLRGPSDMSTAGVQDRARDMVFVLDELTRWNTNDPVFAGRLDLAKVAAMGMSYGGATVAEFGRTENRCKAIIALDPVLQDGQTVPNLRIPLLEIPTPTYGDTQLYSLATKEAIWFMLNGAAHGQGGTDFYPFIWTDRAGLAFSREAARTAIAYELWFLNKYLKGEVGPALPLAGFPLVTGFKQK